VQPECVKKDHQNKVKPMCLCNEEHRQGVTFDHASIFDALGPLYSVSFMTRSYGVV